MKIYSWYLKICLIVLFGSLSGCNPGKKDSEVDIKTTEILDTSSTEQWLKFVGNTNSPHIVLISGDEEYRSEEALPQLAKILSEKHGFNCTVLFAQKPDKPGVVNPKYLKNIAGLQHLQTADLMVIFTRFRELPDDQMKEIDNYLKSGRPVIGMRTSTHAFSFPMTDSASVWHHYSHNYDGPIKEWKGGFGRLVLGERWVSHHGHHRHQSTLGIIDENAKSHPITRGINNGDIWGASDVYEVRLPLLGDSQPIILGQVMNRKGEFDKNDRFYGMRPTDNEIAEFNNKGIKVNDPMMPIAWIKTYQIPGGNKGKVFTTTLGASVDLLSEGVRRLLVNGTYWSLDMEIPKVADVSLIGKYEPSQYENRKNEYWTHSNLTLSNLK